MIYYVHCGSGTRLKSDKLMTCSWTLTSKKNSRCIFCKIWHEFASSSDVVNRISWRNFGHVLEL